MKPTVIWLASLLSLSLSLSVTFAASEDGPPRPPEGRGWPGWSWRPDSDVGPRSTPHGFQKKHVPLVRLKKDLDVVRLKKNVDMVRLKKNLDVVRLKKDIPGNKKRVMDILRLKKSYPKWGKDKDR